MNCGLLGPVYQSSQPGVFSNAADTIEDLKAELTHRFHRVHVRLEGNVALFEAEREGAPAA